MMKCKHILLMTSLNEAKLIFSKQLNCFEYWYLIPIIQLNITNKFTHF